MWIRVLEKQTGKGVATWNQRIRRQRLPDEESLRAWLTAQNVTGYARSLLVMERFGYPDFVLASANDLIDRQYEDRPRLRPIYDAVIAAVREMGNVTIQARKTYVSLVTPRRTFARVQASTRTRVDIGFRLEGQEPGGRLQPSSIHDTMRLQISLTSAAQLDSQARRWLQMAYAQNC